jgi:hypothetical protein
MNEIGQIRPSQLIFTFGIASLIDLPNMSGLVMGLDDWNTQYCREITEDRLLAAIKKRMGAQVARLYLPRLSSTKIRMIQAHRPSACPWRLSRDGCAALTATPCRQWIPGCSS